MAWDSISVPLLRGVLQDMDPSSFKYGEDELEEVLVYAAFFVNNEIDWDTSYVIGIKQFTITPDPSDNTSTDGNLFISLMVLKAGIIIVCGEAKIAATQSIKVVDGPSSIDTGGIYKANRELCNQMRDDYEKLKNKIMLGSIGDLNTAGQAILTPYTQERI
jgi:hypothetical protein